MAKDKKNNKVTKCFEALAEWQNIPLVFGWKAKLVKIIGPRLYIKHSNKIGTWENRKYIPDDTIRRILKLDIPDSVKTLCKNCVKSPPEGSIFNPGSTFDTNGIDICGYHFRNKKIAMKCVNLMWNLEQLDADLFQHTKICLQMLLDGANIMEKKTKNQS